MPENHIRLQEGGRLVIPAPYRKALNMKPGEDIVIRLEDNELRLYPAAQALARAQKFFRKYVHRKGIVDEFIAERRKEAADE